MVLGERAVLVRVYFDIGMSGSQVPQPRNLSPETLNLKGLGFRVSRMLNP